MSPAGRWAAATWTLWGFAAALLGLANLAAMGFDPVPNQHAVVGIGLVVVPFLAGAATQALWARAPPWTWLAAGSAGAALVLLGSLVQSALGQAILYRWGSHASEEAPFALVGALWAAGLTVALRRVAWWPGAVATGLLLSLYLWASTWDWGGPQTGAFFGGAVLNAAVVLVFAAAGWTTFRAARTPGPTDPVRG